MKDFNEPVITPVELTQRLNCGMNAAYKLLRSGDIKAFRIGRSWKIPERSVQEYIVRKSKLENN